MKNHEINIQGLDVILVRGSDAENFLQGQITNDIKLLEKENEAIYAGYCSPKGRLIAFFLIIKVWNNYFLFCPTSISDEISKKLSMYILRSKVLIEKTPDNTSYFSFYGGSKSEEAFKNIWGDVPYPTKIMETAQHPNEQNTTGLLSVTKLPGKNGRFLVIGESENIKMIYDEIFRNTDSPDEKSWNASDIEAKIPNIFKETQDKFIPQSLNLDVLNAVNFKKGCYTGQEIVARTHYLGKSKRRMFQANLSINETFNIGDPIIANNDTVGQVVNYCEIKPGLFQLLIELRLDQAESILLLKDNAVSINLSDLKLFK